MASSLTIWTTSQPANCFVSYNPWVLPWCRRTSQSVQATLWAAFASFAVAVAKNKNHPFNEQNKTWQQLRRGRYVEFNLIYDRGTKYG